MSIVGKHGEQVKSFLSEANPFAINQDRLASTLKEYGVTTKTSGWKETLSSISSHMNVTDKVALYGGLATPFVFGAIGAGIGMATDKKGDTASKADVGFQIGGVAAAGATAFSPIAQKLLGPTKLGGMIGGAATTMGTALWQDDDAGFLQRAVVGTGSFAVGTIAGSGVGYMLQDKSEKINELESKIQDSYKKTSGKIKKTSWFTKAASKVKMFRGK